MQKSYLYTLFYHAFGIPILGLVYGILSRLIELHSPWDKEAKEYFIKRKLIPFDCFVNYTSKLSDICETELFVLQCCLLKDVSVGTGCEYLC